MELAGATVVVIGGSSGMGRATAQLALERGAEVVIVGRDLEKLEKAQAELGGTVQAVQADVSHEDAVQRIFDGLERVDHVVSFAGEQPRSPVRETDYALFKRAMDARVWSAIATCKHALPKMPPSGSFTFASGVSAVRPNPDRSVGAVATAALESFARSMAVELAPIRVNALRPGAISTPVLDRAFGEQREQAMAAFTSRLPAGKVGEPEHIADAVLFLMGNPYVTGITLTVDGGRLLI